MCLCIVLSGYDLTAKVLQIESSYEVIIFEEIANGSVETAVSDHASTFERDKVIECCFAWLRGEMSDAMGNMGFAPHLGEHAEHATAQVSAAWLHFLCQLVWSST